MAAPRSAGRQYYAYELTSSSDSPTLSTYAAPSAFEPHLTDVKHEVDDRPGMYHGQSGQDYTVASLLPPHPTRQRFFVDLAANRPVVFSNSRALERDHGWVGICIEANPSLVPALVHRRNCTVARVLAGSSTRAVRFDMTSSHGGGTSAISTRPSGSRGEVAQNAAKGGHVTTTTAMTMPLQRLLSDLGAPPTIDFLSLDVEGYEEQVLATHDFRRHRFLTIAVERPSGVLKRVLRSNHYMYVLDHGTYGDQFWILNASASRAASLAEQARHCRSRWEAVINHRNWSDRRAGFAYPFWNRMRSRNNCCGVPAAWLENGTVPPDVGYRRPILSKGDLVAPGTTCVCPY